MRDEGDLILLPKQLWCSVKSEGDETCCEVGWLLDEGRTITSKCIFSTTAEIKVCSSPLLPNVLNYLCLCYVVYEIPNINSNL